MDCDQVFMILTRGPFPTGEPWDEQVEAHLETCGDCWRLAEALRPALEVFQEAIPPAEGRDLPGYWGDARPASAVVAQLTRETTRTALTAQAPRIRPLSRRYLVRPLANELSADAFRIIAIAATMTAAALAVVSLLKG
jgi:hypothetical protein